MSVQESQFIKWLAGISATLLVTMTVGAFSVLSSVDVMNERINENCNEIEETRIKHKDDMYLIRNNISEIKDDTKIIKQDIKILMMNKVK